MNRPPVRASCCLLSVPRALRSLPPPSKVKLKHSQETYLAVITFCGYSSLTSGEVDSEANGLRQGIGLLCS